MTELTTAFHCTTECSDGGEHDWSGEPYERETDGGGAESGVTCAKCGMEYGHWALFNLP
jgi:hypothetical protein